MGAAETKYQETFNVYSTVRQFSSCRNDFELLGLTEIDVGKIHAIFAEIDIGQSTVIAFDDLLDFLESERTPFTESVFQMFDKDKNKKIDPYEFVISVWNFCTLTSENMVMFVFELYDKDDRFNFD